jgi:hypothetical protein
MLWLLNCYSLILLLCHSLPPVPPDPSSGLHGPELWLVEGDRGAPNWLGKLGVAKQVLVDRADRARPDVGALAAAYVYLQVGGGWEMCWCVGIGEAGVGRGSTTCCLRTCSHML